MNNGLPSLLDAIFGKNDLSLVSLDEMYEVINEFPSFNAAHFLLSKKLKGLNNLEYEKQSRRTALYFNNAFWLETLLNEGNHNMPATAPTPVKSGQEKYEYDQETPVAESFHPAGDELDEELEEVMDEKTGEPAGASDSEFHYAGSSTGTVSSFDELLSKYKLESEIPADNGLNNETENIQTAAIETTEESTGAVEGSLESPEPVQEIYIEFTATQEEEMNDAVSNRTSASDQDRIIFEESISKTEAGLFEIREEILNEYGIFEEVLVRKSDQDLEAFDRPVDQDTTGSEMPDDSVLPEEENMITVIQSPDDSGTNTDVHDYEAFDRPLDKNRPDEDLNDDEIDEEINEVLDEKIEEITEEISEYPSETILQEADETEQTISSAGESWEHLDGQMQDLSNRFEERQKSTPVFDPKKTESIVFAPYHMIDYFASQGIKLVLEDNPPDHFGQQLKSFTDWLKVMKKLPAQQQTEKSDEKEAERIRHFAAHSIEERDVLTESMAEVLAKQGMYENAIALYHKLSLIYPPKSAYFASRIEQLKASLP